MAAVYPGAIPTYEAAGTYLDSNPHDVLHDELYDEIVAIGTEIGTAAKGSAASVAARMDAIDSTFWTFGTSATADWLLGATTLDTSIDWTWIKSGSFVFARFSASSTTAGSASNTFSITLPLTAASAASICGVCWMGLATDTASYLAFIHGNSTTTAQISSTSLAASGFPSVYGFSAGSSSGIRGYVEFEV